MELELRSQDIEVATYQDLRNKVNWKELSVFQAMKALKNSLYIVVAYDGDKPVGMGRLVGDGVVICYVQDLIVIPEYQGKSVGSQVLEHLISYAKEHKEPGTELMLDLMCAKGRETFYQKHGFIARPTENLGPGMIQYI